MLPDRRQRTMLLLLTSIGAFMPPLDGSILAVALPAMGAELRLSFASTLWVQAVYLVVMAVLLIPVGRWADQRGRLGAYLTGNVLFTAGSLVAALATGGASLLMGRAIQGAGGALLGATSAAMVTAAFPKEQRGRVLGINVMAVYAGLSLGPPLGGFLVQHAGWRWIFLVNLPVGAVVMGMGWWLRKGAPTPSGGPIRVDLWGTALLAALFVSLLVPLTFASHWGWGDLRIWMPLLAFPLFVVGFLGWERRASAPLVDVALLTRNRLFAAANLAALLNYSALYAIGMLTSALLQLAFRLPPQTTGWIMLGQPLTQALLAPWAGRLSDRMGSRALATSGMLCLAAGMGLLAAFATGGALTPMVCSLALVGLGLAAFSAPNTSAVMGSVTPSQLGVASAFLATMRVTGMALSVAFLGGIAAQHLGAGGWKALLKDGADAASLAAFVAGYRMAMVAGACLALLGAWASFVRHAGSGRMS